MVSCYFSFKGDNLFLPPPANSHTCEIFQERDNIHLVPDDASECLEVSASYHLAPQRPRALQDSQRTLSLRIHLEGNTLSREGGCCL